MSGAAASAFGAAGVPPQHATVSGEKGEVGQTPPQGANSSAASTLAGDEHPPRSEDGGNVNVKRAEAQFEVSFNSLRQLEMKYAGVQRRETFHFDIDANDFGPFLLCR